MHATKKRTSKSKGDRYLGFLKTVHLSRLGMDGANFRIDRAELLAGFPESGGAKVDIAGRQEVLNLGGGSFDVLGHFRMSAKGHSDSEFVEITCTLSARFTLDSEAEPEFVERFARNEARLVFWPYLRHFISDCTYRMAIPPFQLPLTSELPT